MLRRGRRNKKRKDEYLKFQMFLEVQTNTSSVPFNKWAFDEQIDYSNEGALVWIDTLRN